MNAFDASSEKSLGTPSGHEEHAVPAVLGLAVCREVDSNGECKVVVRVVDFVPWKGIEEAKQPRFIQNKSGRFESRFVNVRVEKSNAIMLQDMEGSTLGVWVEHGEGRCFWPDDAVKEEAMHRNCVALKYVDDGNVNPFKRFYCSPANTTPCPTVAMRCCDDLLILKGVDRHEKVGKASLNPLCSGKICMDGVDMKMLDVEDVHHSTGHSDLLNAYNDDAIWGVMEVGGVENIPPALSDYLS
ncbi:AIR synthase-related protein [Blastocystis sp. ATCC 50177/Nand II]|uniref:AIR synthase-related protein n=1 Tax=Blastocystis sp. subtype 1 (strain ATCC 50177 / NandII) TaxID=478820 RepID=A0A196SEA4_BLAHN|nr:AIR synthase-related protein [Blastocystis sp. ATCC 50177/Nand II]